VGASSKRRAWAGENFVKQQISGWRRLLAKWAYLPTLLGDVISWRALPWPWALYP
jgi:hypothetical protein